MLNRLATFENNSLRLSRIVLAMLFKAIISRESELPIIPIMYLVESYFTNGQ